MSSTIYNKALELELSHLFYTAAHKFNVNKQLDIFATSATADLVKKGRMRLVRTGAGLNLFYQAYLDQVPAIPLIKPLVELTGELEFVFALVIKPTDNSFLNTTDLDQGGTYSSGKIFLLDGTMPVGPAVPPPANPVNLTLTPSLLDQLRPSVFTYTFLPNTQGLLTDLEVKVFAEGSVTPVLTVNPVLANPATGVYSVQIDLSGQSAGVYTLQAKNGATIEHTASLYIDTELARQNIFGIVRIKYPNPDYFYQGLPDTASYAFVAREVQWRYYIAIKSVPLNFFSNHTLKIIDTNDPSPPFYSFSPLDGGGIPNATVKINGQPTVIITSDSPIPFSENAITRFNLLQNNPVNPVKTLMTSLANAATAGVDSNQVGVPGEQYAEIFVFLDAVSD